MNPLRPRTPDWQRVCEFYRIRPGYWFAPKLYGYGATPVRWQAWVSIALAASAAVGIAWLGQNVHIALLALMLPLLGGFVKLAASKTDGEWRWRWGPRDL